MSIEEREEEQSQSRISKLLRSEVLIGSIVAVMSILTALIGFQASITDSQANEHALHALRLQSEANRESLLTGQTIMRDFNAYDNFFANSNNDAEGNFISSFSLALQNNLDNLDRELFDEQYFDELSVESNEAILDMGELYLLDILSYDQYFASTNLDAADNFRASFSPELLDSLEFEGREPFDQIYFELQYEYSVGCLFESDIQFDLENEVGEVADQYQLVMFIFATGLAMSAWASLLSDTSNMKILFVIFALTMLILGIITYFSISVDNANTLAQGLEFPCLDGILNE